MEGSALSTASQESVCANQVKNTAQKSSVFYQSLLLSGYTGSDCEIEINECDPDPCEHGFCDDLPGDFYCDCDKGWEGKTCEIDKDDCMEKPCINGGYCNDLLNDYQAEFLKNQ